MTHDDRLERLDWLVAKIKDAIRLNDLAHKDKVLLLCKDEIEAAIRALKEQK